jgi:hypothetical protein
MTDGRFERPEIRAYLTQVLTDVRGNLESARGNLADEGPDNNSAQGCISEMVAVMTDMLSKVQHDVRLKNYQTCEQCFEYFNHTGRHERFCSDACEKENDEEIEEAVADREDDCS